MARERRIKVFQMAHPNIVTRSRNRNHLTSFSTALMVSMKGFLVGCSTLQRRSRVLYSSKPYCSSKLMLAVMRA